jgi:iron complex transport system ATP-binding protein
MNTASTNASCLLAVHDLGIQMGTRVLVDKISFEVHAGGIWCVLGPNGSGKSTLLSTLAGLRRPATGAFDLLGRPWPAWTLRDAALKRALLPQQQRDAFSATVLETVLIGRHPHIGPFGWESDQDRDMARRAMHCMDIEALAARDVLSLSGGERQRVALAAALAQDPSVFLLDEPTAHLDLSHQVALFRHLCALAQDSERAVVFATHEYNLAARFATHALLLTGNGAAYAGLARDVLAADRLSDLFGFPLLTLAEQTGPVFMPRW